MRPSNDDYGAPISVWATIALMVLVLMLSGGLGWVLEAVRTYHPQIVAAIIVAIGTIMAALISNSASWFREAANAKRRQTRIANALLLELYVQCKEVARCATMVNRMAADKSLMMLPLATTLRSSSPIVYIALAGELPSLPPKAAGAVIEFYAKLESANRLIDELPKPKAGPVGLLNAVPLKKWQEGNLLSAWRGAAKQASLVLELMEPIASTEKRGDERIALTTLMHELRSIADSGSTPGVTVVNEEQT
jgi:hypothetical protein